MLNQILEAWHINEAITRFMLDEISEEGLLAVPLLKDGMPGKGRSVAPSSHT
jgi:hypothetical protein